MHLDDDHDFVDFLVIVGGFGAVIALFIFAGLGVYCFFEHWG